MKNTIAERVKTHSKPAAKNSPSLLDLKIAMANTSEEQFEQIFANCLDLDISTEERAFLMVAQRIFREGQRPDSVIEKSITKTIWDHTTHILSNVIKHHELREKQQELALTEA